MENDNLLSMALKAAHVPVDTTEYRTPEEETQSEAQRRRDLKEFTRGWKLDAQFAYGL